MSVSDNGSGPPPFGGPSAAAQPPRLESKTITDPTPSISYDPALVQRVFERVSGQLNDRDEADANAGRRPLSTADRRQLARSEAMRAVEEIDVERLETSRPTLTAHEVDALTTAVINRLFGLARLQDYIDDDQNTDIFVNGPDRVHLRRRDGTVIQGEPVADSVEELIDMIQTEARRGRHEQRWDPAAPELNMQLASGDRLHAIAWVSSRPSISIRRHNFDLFRLHQLMEYGTINESLFQFLRAIVLARLNVIVAGGTGAGKTTLLRCLINEIPPDQRIVTVEDNLELGVSHFEALHPNYVELEAREANTEGVGEVTMHDLVKSGLRMGPDRVIVGEIRGAEVVPMLLAMSQGNDGSMSTLHADSSEGVFRRIQMYLAMAPERGDWSAANLLTSNAVDIIVHLARLKTNERVVTSIREVTGIEGESSIPASNEVFSPDATGRAIPSKSMSDATLERLIQVGFDTRWLQPSAATQWNMSPKGRR